MAKEGSKKATAKTVDMSKVKDRGQFNPRHVADGDYPMDIKEVLDHKSKQGNSQWLVVFTPAEGSGISGGASYPYYCSNDDPDLLWKIRNVYMAAGVNVPKKKITLNPHKELSGKRVGVSLEGDEYEGKMKSKIMGVLPLSEIQAPIADAEPDDEEATAQAAASNGKAKKSSAKAGDKKSKGKKGKKSKDTDLEELEVSEL